MHPILFQIGPLTIYSYGAMLAVAVVACSFLLSRDAAKTGLNREIVYDLVFWVVLGGIIGARVFYICISWEYFSHDLLEMLMINRGGLAWQGGFFGGALAGVWFARRCRLSLRALLDLCAPYIALGQSIGRVGCFLNGCCFGKPWDHGIFFPTHQARLYPTQLYETAGLFLIFVVLKIAGRRSHQPGMVFVLYLWLAAIERFIVEFYRADHDTLWLGLSLFQYIALVVFVIGIVIFVRFRKSSRV